MDINHINFHFPKNLKQLIKQSGITITVLSRNTNIPLKTLHGWLAGPEPRNITQVKVLAKYFDLTVDELCFELFYKIKTKEEIRYWR